MTITSRFLGTRVARRILLFFIASAILPVVGLAAISYVRVANQLNEQSRERLQQAARAAGQSTAERLQLIELALIGIGRAARAGQGISEAVATDTVNADRFSLVEHRDYAGVAGLLDEPQLARIRGGNSVILTPSSGDRPNLIMVRAIDPGDLDFGVVWAELDSLRTWGLAEVGGTLPVNMEFCAFASGMVEVLCTIESASTLSSPLSTGLTTSHAGTFEWRSDDGAYVAGYWSLFLRAQFAVDDMILVLSESRASVLAPMDEFKLVFLFTVIMTGWAVLGISSFLIRKSMDPLRRLQEGTRHITRKEFGHQVDIRSGDEFEELGESFNAMGRQLDRQFRTLESRSDIDRAVLSTLDSDHIYETVLTRANQILACDSVSIGVVNAAGVDADWRLISQRGNGERAEGIVHIAPDEAAQLVDAHHHFVVRPGSRLYNAIPTDGPTGSLVFFPLFVKQALAGVIVLSYEGADPPAEDLQDGRQLSDQVAVALSNTHLVDELDALNWGALTALARAIDAKSSWTAGHSERVTQLSLAMAGEIGLDVDQYDTLHRGGLLHDIGKIGIHAEILDKPGRLTREEFSEMQRHTEIGATILEPMAAYAHIIPIVLHHHERLDGAGYPHGLKGDEIPLLARLLSVADVFDALTSERPYRASWPVEQAVTTIEEGAGSQFDPEMVKPFLALMTREPERWSRKRDRVQSVLERGA